MPDAEFTSPIVLSYLVGDELQKIKEDAWYICWRHILLRGRILARRDPAELNPDDCLKRLEYEPLWSLHLSWGPQRSKAWHGSCGRPFRVLVTMLGCPPLGQDDGRAVRDDLLQTTFQNLV